MSPVASSIDAARTPTWTPAQRAKNHAIYLAVSAALFIAARLPRRTVERAGEILGALAHVLLARERACARHNVRTAFPTWDEKTSHRLVRRTFLTLGRFLGETVSGLRGPLEPLEIAPEARELLSSSLEHPEGVLFVSAHLGPWERVAASLVHAGFPLTTVAREPYDPRFQKLYKALRETRGVGAIYRNDRGAAIKILRTLRRRTLLGMPMDLKSRVPSVQAPFLGRLAATPVGPAKIALRTGAVVVVGSVAKRDDGTLHVTAARIDTTGLDEHELTTRLNLELSRRIMQYPEAWPWMHARWS